MKTCKYCQECKPLSEFSKSAASKDGLQNRCKSCMKLYRERNKTSITNQRKEYYAKNKDNIIQKSKNYYLANKDRCRAYQREWIKNNPEKCAQYQKNYAPKLLEYQRNRYKNDEHYRLRQVLKNRIYFALNGKAKAATTYELVGCSMEQLWEHLESQFTAGMSRENYGSWHIDHIIPCAAFDLTDEKQQRTCFHYTNLQPLWAEDNLRKSDSV